MGGTVIPEAPGVPPLAPGNSPPAAVAPATQDTASLPASNTTQWGLYLNGVLAIQPDSLVAFDYRSEYTLSTAPQENGAFQAYDKVQRPYDIRLTMTKGGSISAKQAFLAACDKAEASTDLYTVATPEKVYLNANVMRQEMRRTDRNGVELLTVNLYCEEVIGAGPAQAAAAKSPLNPAAVKAPSAASPQSNGQAQTSAAPSSAPLPPESPVDATPQAAETPPPPPNNLPPVVQQSVGQPPQYGEQSNVSIGPAGASSTGAGQYDGVGAYSGGSAYTMGGGAIDPNAGTPQIGVQHGASGAWQ